MIPKQNRLKDSETIRAIRSDGKSFTSSIAILVVQDSLLGKTRVAFLASRSVGGAVQRNRCKRVLRSRVAQLIKEMAQPHDLLLIARKPLLSVTADEIEQNLVVLFERAKLIRT
ncbi:MAG: ribonuclease P protein component [Anaerolineaceae bacterium]